MESPYDECLFEERYLEGSRSYQDKIAGMFCLKTHRAVCVRTIVVCGMVMLGGASRLGAQNAPVYKVDPFWPKPLPNKWIMQQVPTLIVDKDDHIWVFNRSREIRPDENGASTTPPRTDCCIAGPAVLEFDTEGNLLKGWGGPGYVPNWPREQTINVDGTGNVWVSGTGRGDSILKFTRDGKLLWDFGHRPPRVPPGKLRRRSSRTTSRPTSSSAESRASTSTTMRGSCTSRTRSSSTSASSSSTWTRARSSEAGAARATA